MNYFKNKVIIITGASSGIGKACAYELTKYGAIVCLAARQKNIIDAIEKDLTNNGAKAKAIETDITNETDCLNLINTVISEFTRIDILINNAGISMRSSFADTHIDVLKKLMDVNFWGAVYCTKYALPYLLQSKGSVVAISSVAGFQGLPGRTGYSASKFALHGFLETLRIENLKKGLHVLIVAPWFTKSGIREHALLANGKEQGLTPRQEDKMMSAEHVAQIIARAIVKRKRLRIITLSGKLTAAVKCVLPKLVDRIYYNTMAKEPNSPIK